MGVRVYRAAKQGRTGGAEAAAELYTSNLPGVAEFKRWLAELVDGKDADYGSWSPESSGGGDGDASDASDTSD